MTDDGTILWYCIMVYYGMDFQSPSLSLLVRLPVYVGVDSFVVAATGTSSTERWRVARVEL